MFNTEAWLWPWGQPWPGCCLWHSITPSVNLISSKCVRKHLPSLLLICNRCSGNTVSYFLHPIPKGTRLGSASYWVFLPCQESQAQPSSRQWAGTAALTGLSNVSYAPQQDHQHKYQRQDSLSRRNLLLHALDIGVMGSPGLTDSWVSLDGRRPPICLSKSCLQKISLS